MSAVTDLHHTESSGFFPSLINPTTPNPRNFPANYVKVPLSAATKFFWQVKSATVGFNFLYEYSIPLYSAPIFFPVFIPAKLLGINVVTGQLTGGPTTSLEVPNPSAARVANGLLPNFFIDQPWLITDTGTQVFTPTGMPPEAPQTITTPTSGSDFSQLFEIPRNMFSDNPALPLNIYFGELFYGFGVGDSLATSAPPVSPIPQLTLGNIVFNFAGGVSVPAPLFGTPNTASNPFYEYMYLDPLYSFSCSGALTVGFDYIT